MNLLEYIVNFGERFSLSLKYKKRYIGEYVNVFKKRKLICSVKLTKEQKQQIDDIWKKNYGKKIPYHWHRLYTAYTGEFNPYYFPEIFYSTKLEKFYNDKETAIAYEDKAQLDILLDEKDKKNTLEFLIGRTKGNYFNSNHMLITEREAIGKLFSASKIIIKPTGDTDSGRGVEILECVNGIDIRTGAKTEEIITKIKGNFIVQPFFVSHEKITNLFENCLNTIRIFTYIHNGKVCHGPLSMRIGSGNAEVDNIHAGGYGIGITADGHLKEEAFKFYGESIRIHPDTNIVFKNYAIPSIPEAVELVERLHNKIPKLKFISWDVIIDKNGCPKILEMNTRNESSGFPQRVNGESLFGDDTEEMIALCRRKRKNKEI